MWPSFWFTSASVNASPTGPSFEPIEIDVSDLVAFADQGLADQQRRGHDPSSSMVAGVPEKSGNGSATLASGAEEGQAGRAVARTCARCDRS